jgi:thioredoxin-related protein
MRRLARLFFSRLLLLALLLHVSAAFYSKGSNVVPITDAAGLKRLQRSNYLWILEFYREGCGYCVQAAPEYEKVMAATRLWRLRVTCACKAATSLKRMVGFAAVDVEKQQSIAGQLMQAFGVEVKGVPTIVILKPKTSSQGMTKVICSSAVLVAT